MDDAGRVLISTRETAIKTRNLRRDPRASLCVFTDGFFGEWVQVEGNAEIISLPGAMDLLVDYYRLVSGEHPDWDDYRAAMVRDRRCVRADHDHPGRARTSAAEPRAPAPHCGMHRPRPACRCGCSGPRTSIGSCGQALNAPLAGQCYLPNWPLEARPNPVLPPPRPRFTGTTVCSCCIQNGRRV